VLQENVTYGGTGTLMNLYVPDAVDASPGVVVSLHECSGSGAVAASWFSSLADRDGFLVIAPEVTGDDSDGCWDVASSEALGRSEGSHAYDIASMLEFVEGEYGTDPERVFIAGWSSGGIMTNVMLAVYPELFGAGSILAGAPVGCFPTDEWSTECAAGTTGKTYEDFTQAILDASPGYAGTRPRVQIFHGRDDATIAYLEAYFNQIRSWTTAHGINISPDWTEENTPAPGWVRTHYNYNGSSDPVLVQGSLGTGFGHELVSQGLFGDIVHFFGLDQDPPVGSGGAGGLGGAGGTAMGGSAGAGAAAGSTTGGDGQGGSTPGAGGSTGGNSQGGGGASGGGTSSAGTAGASGGTEASAGGAAAQGGSAGSATGGSLFPAGGRGGTTPAPGGGTKSFVPAEEALYEVMIEETHCQCTTPGRSSKSLAFVGVFALAAAWWTRRSSFVGRR
jgi:acetylxylan esterase